MADVLTNGETMETKLRAQGSIVVDDDCERRGSEERGESTGEVDKALELAYFSKVNEFTFKSISNFINYYPHFTSLIRENGSRKFFVE